MHNTRAFDYKLKHLLSIINVHLVTYLPIDIVINFLFQGSFK